MKVERIKWGLLFIELSIRYFRSFRGIIVYIYYSWCNVGGGIFNLRVKRLRFVNLKYFLGLLFGLIRI